MCHPVYPLKQGVTNSPWHTLALGNHPGTLRKYPGTLISGFSIPWQLTGSRGDLGELKAKAMVMMKAKVKAKIKVKKIKCSELFETQEFEIKFSEKISSHTNYYENLGAPGT